MWLQRGPSKLKIYLRHLSPAVVLHHCTVKPMFCTVNRGIPLTSPYICDPLHM